MVLAIKREPPESAFDLRYAHIDIVISVKPSKLGFEGTVTLPPSPANVKLKQLPYTQSVVLTLAPLKAVPVFPVPLKSKIWVSFSPNSLRLSKLNIRTTESLNML